MAEQFANHPGTTLSAAISSTTRPVTFSVASVANLPTQGTFRVLIDAEILLITTISGTSLTGSNVEGTTAATHVSGANVLHILTAGALAQLEIDAGSALLAAGGTFGGNVSFAGSINPGTKPLLSSLNFGGVNAVWSTVNTSSLNANWTTEFQIADILGSGGNPANDTWAFMFNGRSSGSGSDSLGLVFSVAAQTGALTFATPATFNGSVIIPASLTVSNAANVVFGSGWASWTPTIAASGSMTVSSPTIFEAIYYRIGAICYFNLAVSITLGGTVSNEILFSLPFTHNGNGYVVCSAFIGGNVAFAQVPPSTNSVQVYPNGLGNYTSGTNYISVSGFFRCA